MMTPTDLNSAASSFTAGSTEHHLRAMDKHSGSAWFFPQKMNVSVSNRNLPVWSVGSRFLCIFWNYTQIINERSGKTTVKSWRCNICMNSYLFLYKYRRTEWIIINQPFPCWYSSVGEQSSIEESLSAATLKFEVFKKSLVQNQAITHSPRVTKSKSWFHIWVECHSLHPASTTSTLPTFD